MIVPGGGLSPDGSRWISSRPAFLLPVRVLGKLFRRLFLTRLMALQDAGRLAFYGSIAHLADRRAFLRHLAPVRKKRWVVYAKPPFAGPEAVLAYLSRYTHRVAISNSRFIRFDETGVTFRYKDYRRGAADRQQVMTLAADEFIRRFLLHVLPKGFHRIRHYGLLAGATRKAHLDHVRQLLGVAPATADDATVEPADTCPPCPCCGGHMVIVETFERQRQPARHRRDTVKLIDQRYTECFGTRNAGPGCYGAYRAGARSLPAETMGYLAATAPMRTSGDRATPRSRRRSPAG